MCPHADVLINTKVHLGTPTPAVLRQLDRFCTKHPTLVIVPFVLQRGSRFENPGDIHSFAHCA